jgi:hypothetical protein
MVILKNLTCSYMSYMVQHLFFIRNKPQLQGKDRSTKIKRMAIKELNLIN